MIADDWEIDKGSKTIKWTGVASQSSVSVTQLYQYMKDLSRQDDFYAQQKEARERFIETLKQL